MNRGESFLGPGFDSLWVKSSFFMWCRFRHDFPLKGEKWNPAICVSDESDQNWPSFGPKTIAKGPILPRLYRRPYWCYEVAFFLEIHLFQRSFVWKKPQVDISNRSRDSGETSFLSLAWKARDGQSQPTPPWWQNSAKIATSKFSLTNDRTELGAVSKETLMFNESTPVPFLNCYFVFWI